jgi:26S proteasome regulatory subunit N6
MAVEDNAKRIEEAKASKDTAKSEKIYKDILSKAPGSTDRAVRDFENALVALGELYRDQKRTDDLAALITQTRDVLTSFTRAKTAKLGMRVK